MYDLPRPPPPDEPWSRERAVAYRVLATDGEYDGQNFCQMGIARVPAHVEQRPPGAITNRFQ